MTPSDVVLPDSFARTIIDLHADVGAAWLRDLPALLEACARRWRLVIGPPFVLSYNYVAPAIRADGTQVVLKAGVPEGEIQREMEALRLFDGDGMVRLLEADRDRGVLLLEGLEPGTPLSTLVTVGEDEKATSVAVGVMRGIWRPVPSEHAFPSAAGWARGLQRLRAQFDGTTGPLPADLVEEAESLFDALLASMETAVLLHGDLHHDNILAAGPSSWRAIDPKGLIGEPAYEVGALLHNPMPQLLEQPDAGRLLARRVDQLSEELELDRARVRGYGLAVAVLSAWWSVEDHGQGWEAAIACARHLSAIKA